MKNTKKIASLLLALIMVLSISAVAFAEGQPTTTGKITVENAVEGQTYTIYKLLELDDSVEYADGNYAYKVVEGWRGFFETGGAGAPYVYIDTQGYDSYVTWVGGEGVAAFAKAAQEYASENSNSITSQGSTTATTTTVTFDNLELGYYLLDSSLGTLCSLNTTDPEAIIKEKNAAPTNEKKVEEDSNSNYGSVNDADIGQTVNFKSTITLPKGSENVTFHDTMSKGLTLDAESVEVYTDADMTTKLDSANYTVTTGPTDGCTFEVFFKQTYLDGLNDDSTTVYVGYSATVNSEAVVGGAGNPNTSNIEYGEEGKTTKTPGSETITYTWSFDILKYSNGDATKPLEGAEFVLLKKEANGTKNKVATIVNGKLTEWVDVPAAGDDGNITWPTNTVQTTDTQGKIAISGLDADTYYLRETKAPNGYNKLSKDVEVKIEPTTATDGKTMTLSTVTAKVNNQSGSELPTTGGIGTTIFYVIGSILVIGAAVLLITKKRMSAKK